MGYIGKPVGYYVKLWSPELELHGSIKDYATDCNKQLQDSFCSNKYLIPNDLIKGKEALGVGVLLSASKFYCEGEEQNYIGYDDLAKPGKLFDQMNTYQTVDLNALGCEGSLVAESWSMKGSVRTGYQSGVLVSGSRIAVGRVKALTEFFNVNIFRTFTIIIGLLLYALNAAHRKRVITVKEPEFLEAFPVWLLFFAGISGSFQLFLPLVDHSLIVNRVVAGFSLGAHALPVLALLTRDLGRRKRLLLSFFGFCILIFIMSTSAWLEILLSFFFLASTSYVFLYFIRGNLFYLFFGLVSTFSLFKMLNYPYFPSARTSGYFVGFYFLIYGSYKLKYGLLQLKEFSQAERALRYMKGSAEAIKNYQRNSILLEQAKEVCHDLRAPLALLKALSTKEGEERSVLASSVQRIERITGELLARGRNGPQVPLEAIISLAVSSVEYEKMASIAINFEKIKGIAISSENASRLERVLVNLIENSLEAYPNNMEDSEKWCSVEGTLCSEKMKIRIRNRAPEIPQEILVNLNLGVGFTTKVKGIGIGAVSSMKRVKKMGGELKYTTGRINEVLVVLPSHILAKLEDH